MNCPECGAPNTVCEARYHECLVKEFSDPGYGTVHNLTVAAYMLQHSSKLTKEGWLETRKMLEEFLVKKKSPAWIVKHSKALVDSGKRKFKITSRDGRPVIKKTTWTKTILDVRMENASVYCADVSMWARSVLEEAERLKV